jgi:hypothetical protein
MSEHLSLTLKSLLKDLSENLDSKDPQDVHAMHDLKRKLGELRNTLERESAPLLGEVTGIAVRLVEELGRSGLVGPKESIDIVDEVLGIVRGSLGVSAEKLERAPQDPGAALRLIDGQRLGHLLVTLSMLSPEDVERALRSQKMNGLLLGEALVEQGVLSKESIQAALRLQRARRDREGGDGAGARRPKRRAS